MMVFNRLCAPESKLGCLAWLEWGVLARAEPSVLDF